MNLINILFIITGLVSGILATWIVRQCAVKMGIVNHPNPIVPQHQTAVAYLGGAGIFLGLIPGVICLVYFNQLPVDGIPVSAILTGIIAFLVLGISDDLKPFSAFQKMIGQLMIAIACVLLGLKTHWFDLPFADEFFSIFWIVLVVNAVNFTDVCDGLVAGIAAAVFLILGIVWMNPFFMLLAATICGFLVFNIAPASIFLGDAGSHLLGFLLAATAILHAPDSWIQHILFMGLICGVPLFELLFITVMRLIKGKAWWKGSPDHFALRLQHGGLSRLQTAGIAWACSLILSIVAIFLPAMSTPLKWVVVLCIILFFAWAWFRLMRLDTGDTKAKNSLLSLTKRNTLRSE